MAHSFEESDLELLGKSMKLRERMMNNIAKRDDNDLPVKPSDLMAVTNLLESMDRSIYTKAKINIDDSSSRNEEATREVLRGLMVDLHNQRVLGNTPSSQGQIPGYKSITDITVNEGELITKSDNYSPTE